MTEEQFSNLLTAIGLIMTIAIAVVGGFIGLIVLLLKRNADGTSQRSEKAQDKQGSHSEVLAGHSARLSQLENDRGKIADALDRLARIEEWRIHSTPRLDEVEHTVEATARTMVAFDERMKTVFKRLDAMTEHMKELPVAVASELRSMFRTASPERRASNG